MTDGNSAEPSYHNWLIPRQNAKTKSSESTIHIPPGLHLSTRRGPEVELYDVTGVHLLSAADSSNDSNPTFREKRAKRWRSRLCWKRTYRSQETVPVVLANNKASDMKSAASSDYTLGRLPTKTSQGNNLDPIKHVTNVPFTPATFNSYQMSVFEQNNGSSLNGSNCASFVSCDHTLSSCFHRYCLDCTHPSINKLPSEHRNYYNHCFTLLHHRVETSIILILTLLTSLAELLFIVLNATYEQIGFPGLSFTAVEIGRLSLFSLSCILGLFGLICVNWHYASQSTSEEPQCASKSLTREGPSNAERKVAYHLAHLLAAQGFNKRLRVTYIFVYLSCLCLATAMLPWFPLAELSASSTGTDAVTELWYRYNCSRGEIVLSDASGLTNLSNALLHLTPWRIRAANAMAPADCIWVVLWITVAVHGLLDLDRLWSRRLPYAFTVTLAVAHLILTNVFHMLTQSDHGLPPNRALSNTFTGACAAHGSRSTILVDRTSWWDNPASLMGRQNIASLLAFIIAHLIGQLIARWTARHRYGLFILASHCQAKLDRLGTTEDKLMQLASSLVPMPLAKDLAQDFITGYLAWSSPLVIYLRNVSFISVELVGLSTVASAVASATNASSASSCQQFVAFLNDLFGCFDRLARVEGCYRARLNATEYMCIAGYPETRVDHARSCVDFGLAMLKTISELSQMTNVQLELRVAVHTGTAYAAVLGRSRLGFELTGVDVDFVSQLRQLAVRPGRVLTSRSTFGQLPEGFRGEAGPTVPFPGATTTLQSSLDSPSVPSDHVSHMIDTFFVQPRTEHSTMSNDSVSLRTASSPDPARSNALGLGFKGFSKDWPKLTEFSMERMSLLNRLSSSASVICRRPVQEQDTAHPTAVEQPLDFLLSDTAGTAEASKEVRFALLQTLSSGDFRATTAGAKSGESQEPLDRSTHGSTEPGIAVPVRDPSTTELLAMAAVTLAKSFEHDDLAHVCHDKNVPCQRRAGRLRGKFPTHTTELADSTDAGSGLGADNSMGTSLATMTTTAMNPSLPSQDHTGISGLATSIENAQYTSPLLLSHRVSLLSTSPPGQSVPHWLTLQTTENSQFTHCSWPCMRCPLSKLYSSLATTEGVTLIDGKSDGDQRTGPQSRASTLCCCPVVTDRQDEKGLTVEEHGEKSTTDATPRALPLQTISLTVLTLIPLFAIFGLIHLVLMSRSYLYFIAYAIALIYLSAQLLFCILFKRFSRSSNPVVRLLPARLFVISSILVITAACAVNLVACFPGLPVRLLRDNVSYSTQSTFLITNLKSDSLVPYNSAVSTTTPVCPISGQFMLLGCTGVMMIAMVGASTLYPMISTVTVFPADEDAQETYAAAARILSQPIRLAVYILVLTIYVACLLWATFQNGALQQYFVQFGSNQNELFKLVVLQLMRATFVQHLLAFGAFALLAFVLPRGLEFQCILFHQWLTKNQSVTHSMSATRLALARLLLSVVPRYVIAVLCNPVNGKSASSGLYEEHCATVGLALVQLTGVCPSTVRDRKTSTDRTASGAKRFGADEPAQIADRLRLVNHVIGLVDALVDDKVLDSTGSTSSGKETDSLVKSTETPMTDPRLVKVYVGGTVLGYAVGLMPSKTIRDPSFKSKQTTSLLDFAERVLQLCEEANAKTRMANGLVHARIALHTGPALVGLIGKQRPTFSLWGESVQLCQRLLQESHIPALDSQHLVLATDEVMSVVPPTRLGSASTIPSNRPLLTWRCVDSQTGKIVPSIQARSLLSHTSAPGGPTVSKPFCLPLHFCSIPMGMGSPEEDATSGDSAARAVMTVAQRTSSRSIHDHSHSMMHHGSVASPVVSPRVPNTSIVQSTHQSVRMSHVPSSTPHVDASPGSSGWGLHNSQSDVPLFGLAQQSPGYCVVPTSPTTHASMLQSPSQFHGVPPPPPHQRPYPSTCGPTATTQFSSKPAPGGPVVGMSSVHSPRMTADNLLDQPVSVATAAAFAQLRAAPDRKTSEANNAIVNRRRGVVSQFPSGTHEYSIVNTEPPVIGRGPNQGRVTSQVIDPRQTQPVPGLFREDFIQRPVVPGHNKRGDYWSNSPPQNTNGPLAHAFTKPVPKSTVADTSPHLMLSLLNKPAKPGDLRPISLSSTDSFLAAERACAVSDFGDDAQMKSPPSANGLRPSNQYDTKSVQPQPGEPEDDPRISHHNPMYTDNEYESMTESQGNLVDAGTRTPSSRPARSHSNPSSHPLQKSSQFDSRGEHPSPTGALPASSSSSATNQLRNHAGPYEVRTNTTIAGNGPYPPNQLNFPDIQRPSSPCAVHDRFTYAGSGEGFQRPSAYIITSGSGIGPNSQGKQPRLQQSSSGSGASSGARSANGPISRTHGLDGHISMTNGTGSSAPQSNPIHPSIPGTSASSHCSDSILLDQSKNGVDGLKGTNGKHSNAPALILPASKSESPEIADPDGTDVEYMGTYSLGPVSMVVIPSVAEDGLTSCDGDELGPDDEEDLYADDDEDDYAGDDDDASAVPDSLASSFHQMENNPLLGHPNYPNWSANHQLFPPTSMFAGYGIGMTDSLLANPDLDARESELGDEFDLAGSVALNGSSPPPTAAFNSSHLTQLCGRIEPKQAPEFLEAALLPPSSSVPSYTTGGDNSPKELYSLPATEDFFQSDTDDLFAYHVRPGMGLNSAIPTAALQQPVPMFTVQTGSQPSAITPQSITGGPVSSVGHMAGRSVLSSHALLRLNSQPTRPTLPEIAPVSLPDFTQPLGQPRAEQVPPAQVEISTQSDYDNVCPSTKQKSTKSIGTSTAHGCASARKLAAVARHRANRWQSLTPGDESDAMSGYIGDAASSVYDTGDDDDDDGDDEDAVKETRNPESMCDVTQLYIPHPPFEPLVAEFAGESNGKSTTAPASEPTSRLELLNSLPSGAVLTVLSSGPVITNGTRFPTTSVASVKLISTTSPAAQTKPVEVHRTPSSAESQTSGPEIRSEYDNVNTNESRHEAALLKGMSPTKRSSGRSPRHAVHRTESLSVKRSEITQRLFDAQIAAEARRISRQFRAMGWLPAASSAYSPVAQHSPTEVDEAFGLHTAGSSVPIPGPKPVSLARPHLFLLPMDASASNPCSRQTSFHNRAQPGAGGSMMDSETITTVTSQFDDEDEGEEEDEDENDEFAPQGEPTSLLNGFNVQTGASRFHVPWDMGYGDHSPDTQLGCLLVRPRSLSATCLNSSISVDGYRASFLGSSSSNLSSESEVEHERTGKDHKDRRIESQPANDSEQTQKLEHSFEKPHLLAPAARRCDRQRRLSSPSSPGHRSINTADNQTAFKRRAISPGLSRLQRRAARVRSLIPPELLPYILPSCMSSPSRSSSMVSSAIGQSGMIFLSLARPRRSRKSGRSKRDRAVDPEPGQRRCTSDPELSLSFR